MTKENERENEEERKGMFLPWFFPSSSFVVFFLFYHFCLYLVAMFFFNCTHCDTSLEIRDRVSEGTLLGEFTYKKAVHTYFAFTTAKTEETVTAEAFWVT